jgi:hypothetical protein
MGEGSALQIAVLGVEVSSSHQGIVTGDRKLETLTERIICRPARTAAAFWPHYLLSDRKIATAGSGPTSYLPSMLTSSGGMVMKNGPLLAVLVAGAAVALMPVSAAALCDPNGPRGSFVYGIPASDNPVWCEMSRGSTVSPDRGGYGYGYETAPTAHHRALPRRHR